MSSTGTVALSKEQAAILLPLLPTLAQSLAQSSPSSAESLAQSSPPSNDAVENCDTVAYTNTEMFSRKKKNTRSTAAQNHLLVSVIVTTS